MEKLYASHYIFSSQHIFSDLGFFFQSWGNKEIFGEKLAIKKNKLDFKLLLN